MRTFTQGSTHDSCEGGQSVERLGRRLDSLWEVQDLVGSAGAKATVTAQLDAVREADLVLAVTSSIGPLIGPEYLKPDAVVCDVARPRNVSRRVAVERDDIREVLSVF
jgi:fatty aldehyde-generating acyl-ACP reductase